MASAPVREAPVPRGVALQVATNSAAPPQPLCWGLSTVAWSTVVLVALTCVGVIAADWRNIVVLPLALLPPAVVCYVVYWLWLRPRAPVDDAFLRMFGWGYLPGALIAMALEVVLTALFALMFLPGNMAEVLTESVGSDGGSSGPGGDGKGSGSGPGYTRSAPQVGMTALLVAFIAFTSYVTAAGVEEVVKAMAVRMDCCMCILPGANCCLQQRRSTPAHQRAYVTVSLLLAAAVGFSAFENVLYVFQAGITVNGMPVPWSAIALRAAVAVLRGCISMPVHATCVAFTALRLTLRDAQLDAQERLRSMAEHDGLFQFHPASTAAGAGTPVFTVTAPPDMRGGGVSGWPAGTFTRVMSKEAAAAQLATVRPWAWWRILWPSIAIHGTFDFQALLLGAMLPQLGLSDTASTAITITLGFAVLATALWIARQQYVSLLDRIARNDVPAGITMGVDWHLFTPSANHSRSPATQPPTAGDVSALAPPLAAAPHAESETAPLVTGGVAGT